MTLVAGQCRAPCLTGVSCRNGSQLSPSLMLSDRRRAAGVTLRITAVIRRHDGDGDSVVIATEGPALPIYINIVLMVMG